MLREVHPAFDSVFFALWLEIESDPAEGPAAGRCGVKPAMDGRRGESGQEGPTEPGAAVPGGRSRVQRLHVRSC